MGTEPWKGQRYVKEGPNYAASYVSWDDAVAYCKKLSESQADLPAQKKTPVLLGSAAPCDLVPQSKVEDRGLEPVRYSPRETAVSDQGNAESNAFSGDDERLRVLWEAWADLSESVKDAVLELVKEYEGQEPA